MEKNIKTIILEIEGYYRKIVNIPNFDTLTAIQKNEYKENIKKEFQSNGITFHYGSNDYKDPNAVHITFEYANIWINDFGIIEDVSEKNNFPIKLKIDNNISINYEPRNLTNIPKHQRNEVENFDFLTLKKGEKYTICGKLQSVYCYIDKRLELSRYILRIGGEERNEIEKYEIEKEKNRIEIEIDKANLNKAISLGTRGALVGGLIGTIPAFVITGIIAAIFSWSYLIFISIVIVCARLGYFIGFHEPQKTNKQK